MKLSFYIVLLFLFLGCGDDGQAPDEIGKIIQFGVTSYTGAVVRTPGVDDLGENAVSSAYVFFYTEDGSQCLYFPSTESVVISSMTIKVAIPETAIDILDRPLIIYVLVNCNLSYLDLSGKTLSQLQSLVHENSESFNNEEIFTAQNNFLMDGKIEGAIIPTIGSPNLPVLELRRAAAKIVVNITNTNVDNYDAVSAKIRLSNYLDKTALGADAPFYTAQAGDYSSSPYRTIGLTADPDQRNNIFYSYANDWEYDALFESYIMLSVLWRNKASSIEKEYFYRIPFNYVPDDPDDTQKFRLRRNHIYAFNVNISGLGGLDPALAVDLTPHFTLRNWLNDEVLIDLNVYEYLVVNERYVEIYDVTTREIQYVSSKDIQFEDVNTWYNEYRANGDIVRKDIVAPQMTINDTSIEIEFINVPDNYVPRNLEFTVKNTAGLSQKVTLIQYPPLYITSEFSTGNVGTEIGEIDPGNNHNLYTITITKPNTTDGYVIGDPARYVNGKLETLSANNTKNLVSPKFVVASQRGESRVGREYAELWTKAIERCQTYYEDPYPKGKWRLPTLGELELLYKLHVEEKSALKKIFTGGGYGDEAHRYWSATEYYDSWSELYHWGKDTETGSNYPYPLSTTSKTRCVYDVWRK